MEVIRYFDVEFGINDHSFGVLFDEDQPEESVMGDVGYFVLPIATTERLGGIKVGDRLVAEADGRLSVVGGADVDMDEITNQDIKRIIQGG